ncbi:MAG: putative toxin-antitoxin system toxin component, PIN family, partial [Bradymonadaceae bacterium]
MLNSRHREVERMPRITVTLSDELYRALKETAARRDTSMREIVEESLEAQGLKSVDDARELVARAREASDLDPDAATRRILDAMIDGELEFYLSVELLAEYREVLLRPAIADHHGLSDDEVDAILEELALHGQFRSPPSSPSTPPDTGDQHLWDLVHALPDCILVTGD